MNTPVRVIPAAIAAAVVSTSGPYVELIASRTCDEGAPVEHTCALKADPPMDFHSEVERSEGVNWALPAVAGSNDVTVQLKGQTAAVAQGSATLSLS